MNFIFNGIFTLDMALYKDLDRNMYFVDDIYVVHKDVEIWGNQIGK